MFSANTSSQTQPVSKFDAEDVLDIINYSSTSSASISSGAVYARELQHVTQQELLQRLSKTVAELQEGSWKRFSTLSGNSESSSMHSNSSSQLVHDSLPGGSMHSTFPSPAIPVNAGGDLIATRAPEDIGPIVEILRELQRNEMARILFDRVDVPLDVKNSVGSEKVSISRTVSHVLMTITNQLQL
jgi:hypothetical protein